jgi:transcriptional regulator with XRE-family HTH domain
VKSKAMKNAALCLEFGRRLRQIQIRRAMSLDELAAGAKLAPDYVRRLIAGLQEPRIGVLVALARALDVEPGALLAPVERMKLRDRVKSSPVVLDKMFPDLVAKGGR